MENPTVVPPRPEPDAPGCSLAPLFVVGLVPTAIVGFASYGWRLGGRIGLAVGLIAGAPLAFLFVGLLGAIALGYCALFDRAEFDRIVGKAPSSGDAGPASPANLPSACRPQRPGQFRIRSVLIAIAVLGLWLGVGVALVRASKTERAKETAVLIALLVPPAIVANHHAQRWAEARLGKATGPAAREP